MATDFTLAPYPRPREGRSGIRHALTILGIAVLLVGVTVLIYASGGSDGPFTYIMLLPLLIAAGTYGVLGGLGTGLLGGILIGPTMPQDVTGGLAQSPDDWLVRLAVFAVVGLVSGVSQRRFQGVLRRERQALRRDPSTGLANQAAFMEDLSEYLAPEAGTETRTAAVLLRATDFNDIVEVLGVEGGDRIMGEIGEHLNRICPEVQGIYRFSTSELALIVDADSHEALKRIARTLHGAASASFEVEGVPVRMEPALGIGHRGSDEAALGSRELLRRARIALRRAVSLEREWVSYEPAFDTDKGATLELIARAERALEAGEFELHYQPKVRLADNRPAGVEALARWRRPEEGLVAPGLFMPKLEQTSLIEGFSRFVIRTATDYARTGPLVPVSINLAPRNLADDTLINALIEGLRQTAPHQRPSRWKSPSRP